MVSSDVMFALDFSKFPFFYFDDLQIKTFADGYRITVSWTVFDEDGDHWHKSGVFFMSTDGKITKRSGDDYSLDPIKPSS